MGRRYDENIRVRTRSRSLDQDPAGRSPERFVWQGRLYLVQEVLASWRERRPWWVLEDESCNGRVSGSLVEVLEQGADRQCWRVRAQRGSAGPSGVYELTLEPAFGRTFEQIVGGGGEGGDRREAGSGTDGVWLLSVVGD